MNTYGAHRVVVVGIGIMSIICLKIHQLILGYIYIYPSISWCIFKQIIDMMPIPVGVVPVLVNEFLSLYSPGFLSFPRALSFRLHYKKSFWRLLDETETSGQS